MRGQGATYDAAGELRSLGNATYSYDQLGDRTGSDTPDGPTSTLDYNEAAELTSFTRSGSQSSSDGYAYDGDGLRQSGSPGMIVGEVTR